MPRALHRDPLPSAGDGVAPRRRLGLAAALALAGAACARLDGLALLVSGPPAPPADRPLEVPTEGFVSSDACRACHAQKYDTWAASYHRTMTQEVTPETVLAPFDGVELAYLGRTYRLEQRGDEFWVELEDPAWDGAAPAPRVWRQIVLSTGSHHFQAYWFASGEARKLSLFLLCYRIDEGLWMPVDSAFLARPEVRRETGLGRWNHGCQQCHTTKGKPRLLPDGSLDTHAVEFGIACEACHGPGAEHVEANRDPRRRYALHLDGAPDPTIVDPSDLGPRLSSQVCGQCHGITSFRTQAAADAYNLHGKPFVPGRRLTEDMEVTTHGEQFFWSDGMVRVSGREYNGLLESPCYQHGERERMLTCLSCHQMHRDPDDPRGDAWRDDQLAPDMEGDRACTQCHAEYDDPERVRGHTRHAPGTPGSACYDCHMPHTTWGLLKGIRSHTISSPTVVESLDAGRPNACNLCHLDRTLAWTAERLGEDWGIESPALPDEHRTTAASILWLLSGDAGQRALVAAAMGRADARAASGTDWLPPYLAQLLDDPYDAVRFRASRSLRTLPGFADLEYDFVGPAEERRAAAEAAAAVWRARRAEERGAEGARLLLGTDGALDETAFRALLRQRDDRPMVLAE